MLIEAAVVLKLFRDGQQRFELILKRDNTIAVIHGVCARLDDYLIFHFSV
jgi:hypothetical protein